MKTEIIVALIALTGVIFSGGFALLNIWIQRRLTEVKKKQDKNDIYEIQNNVLEQLIPLFEKKDLALDRLADILEEISKRVEFIEKENRQLSGRIDQKCLAPMLLQEVSRIQEMYGEKEVSKGIIDSLIRKDVENS